MAYAALHEIRNSKGETYLHIAIRARHDSVAASLINRGLSLEDKTNENKSALDMLLEEPAAMPEAIQAAKNKMAEKLAAAVTAAPNKIKRVGPRL